MALFECLAGGKEWLDAGDYIVTSGTDDETSGSYTSGTALATVSAVYVYTLLFNPRTNNTTFSLTANGNVNSSYFVIKNGVVIDKGHYTGASYSFNVTQDCDFVLFRGNSGSSGHNYTVTITDN